jgi:Ricin-type beta-trefoil lectin domain
MKIPTRMAVLATALALTGTMLAAIAGPANAAPPAAAPALAAGTQQIVNRLYSQCVTAPNGTVNVVLVLYVCLGSSFDSWTLVPAGPVNTYYLVNQLSGLCAEVNNGTSLPFERVDDFYCNGTRAEQWIKQEYATVGGVDYYLFVHYGTYECLDTVGSYSSQLMQYDCHGNYAQQWKLI